MTPINSSNIVDSEVKLKSKKWTDGLIFVIVMWLLSRLVIIVAMQLIAPLLHTLLVKQGYPLPSVPVPSFVPKTGWELFSHWDGPLYGNIATLGYDYANDGQPHTVAFFPLFPLLCRGLMILGLPFEVAGVLVNNLALLGALLVLYRWAQERHGISAAKWATAVLAWCPFSLFGTVIYTEGLYLLITTAALRAFDKRQHAWAALWGAMATAARAPGVALVPTFLLVAWAERRSAIAYAAGLATGVGLLLFSVYCAIRFGEPLAFVHVNKAWPQPNGLNLFMDLLFLDPPSVIRVVILFGGGYLLWRLRFKLPSVAVAYGFCSLALLLSVRALNSFNRYAYGIVSLSLALGVLLACHPRWGYGTMVLFAMLLVSFSIRFAWWYWVG